MFVNSHTHNSAKPSGLRLSDYSASMTRVTKASRFKTMVKSWRSTVVRGDAGLLELCMLDNVLKATGNRLSTYDPKPREEGAPLPPLAERPTLICNVDAATVGGSIMGWLEYRFRAMAIFDFSHNDMNDAEDGVRDAGLWGKGLRKQCSFMCAW